MLLIITVSKYILSLLLMFAISVIGVFCESLSRSVFSKFSKHGETQRVYSATRKLLASYRRKITLPETANMPLALYGSALSFAALIPVCAAIPFCTLIPVMDNGADVLQIMQFYMLSEALSIISLYSLGSKEAGFAANKCIKESFMLMIPLVSFLISIAAFFEAGGGKGDAFSLNAFSLSQKFSEIGTGGTIGVIIFIFLIFTQIPHSDIAEGTLLFDDSEMPSYQGCPRAILQLRGIFRSFLVVTVVVNMFFPLGDFAVLPSGSIFSWNAQLVNFIIFWLAVIFARVVCVNFSWVLYAVINKLLPGSFMLFFVPGTALIAAALLLHEVYVLSSEIAAF